MTTSPRPTTQQFRELLGAGDRGSHPAQVVGDVSSGFPSGWTGGVSCRFLPTGNEVMPGTQLPNRYPVIAGLEADPAAAHRLQRSHHISGTIAQPGPAVGTCVLTVWHGIDAEK